MKNNLAKVLGLEELQQTAPLDPSDDQVMQQQISDVTEHMQQTADATDVALESIGNALQLQSVIQNNDSKDHTTYAVLRTAVEQLKERTGVKTQSVALEDLSPLSYKTEAIEDIKKFAAKVWEAIKKAFAAMVEKVKAFFKKIFDKGEIANKYTIAVEESLNRFTKAMETSPKSSDQARKYIDDFATKEHKRNSGHSVNSWYFNFKNKEFSVKPVRVSDDEKHEYTEAYHYNRIVIDTLSLGKDPAKWSVSALPMYKKLTADLKEAFNDFEDYLINKLDHKKLMDFGYLLGINHDRIYEISQSDDIVKKTINPAKKNIFQVETNLGGSLKTIIARESDTVKPVVEVTISKGENTGVVGLMDYTLMKDMIMYSRDVAWQSKRILNKLSEFLEIEKRNFDTVQNALKTTHKQKITQEDMQAIRDSYTDYFEVVSGSIKAAATLSKIGVDIQEAVADYIRQTLRLYKHYIEEHASLENYNFEKLLKEFSEVAYRSESNIKWN